MRKRMILNQIIVLIFFAVMTYYFIISTVYEMIQTNLVTVSSQTMTSSANELNNILNFGPNYMLQLCVSSELQDSLSDLSDRYHDYDISGKTVEGLPSSNDLNRFMSSNTVTVGGIPFMVEITARTDAGGYLPVYSSNRSNKTLQNYAPDNPWIRTLESNQGRFLWDSFSDQSNTYIRLSKLVFDNSDFSRTLGIISLDFSYDHLAKSILTRLYNDAGISAAFMDSRSGEIIGYRTVPVPEDLSFLKEENDFPINAGSAHFFSRPIHGTNLCLVGIKSMEEARQAQHKSVMSILMVTGVALLLGSFLAVILSHRISLPLILLSRTMTEMKDGNLDITVSTTEKDEIGHLYDSFNYMIRKINRLIEENYLSRIRQKDAELNALSSQINTHFLYNTLDSIKWLALDYHAQDISTLVTDLSSFLRLSLNNGRPELSVRKELEHAHNYLDIQMIRFQDLFRFEENIDPALLSDKVLKMLLQPLIENAIIHSFTKVDSDPETNLLILNLREESEALVFEVINNADPEDLDSIYEILGLDAADVPEDENRIRSNSHYGIRSISERLSVAYEGSASLTYDMDTSGMLHAMIRIPRKYTKPGRTVKPHAGN